MDGIAKFFPASVTASSTVFLHHLLLIFDTKDARWREQTTDNDMLCQSIMANEGGNDPKYTSTYLEAVIDGDTMGICVKEATNSILRWMDMQHDQDNMSDLYAWTAPEDLLLQWTGRIRQALHYVAAEHSHRGLPR